VTELDNRNCVVTGASSGIGRALAVALAAAGANVWALGRSWERLGALRSDLSGSSARVASVVVDLEKDEEIEGAADEILAGGDRVDVLVHSAGAIALGAVDSLSAGELDRMYRVNLRSAFVLTQALLPALRRARGQIVVVNSSAALKPSPNNALYAATKVGLKAFADGLRDEVNSDGVRVVSVYVGRTATPMQEWVHEYEGRNYRSELLLRPEDVVHVVLSVLTLPPSAEVTEVSIRPMSKLES
jgi:NADP-dependent 3-hydroxy acid dehydrogenase YdfG